MKLPYCCALFIGPPALWRFPRALFLAGLLICPPGLAAPERIEPPSWWAGMDSPGLQLLVYGRNMGGYDVRTDYPGVSVQKVRRVDSPNYLFVDLELAPTVAPGEVRLQFFHRGEPAFTRGYPLLERAPGAARRQGFSPADVIYLIMPDRFANGEAANDTLPGLREGLDRSNPTGRHGGDLQGITRHLDYLADLGITQIWLNPVLENDQALSYHGYAATDMYRVDPRLGGNPAYLELSREARKRGIGLIKDVIPNHIGSEHWWMRDLPSGDWINQGGKFVGTNHHRESIQDPHAAASDRSLMQEGWFVPTMPDLNQRNPLLATYLIQNSLWWIETADLTGLRVDTYPYIDQHFMVDWTRRLLAEYPLLNIVGEEWSMNPAIVSYWQSGKHNADGYRSHLPSLIDFPLYQATVDALREEESWNSGLVKIYRMIANDFLYPDPGNLVVIADNHDMSRVFTQLDERPDLFRMSMIYLLTTRGIPQLLYGTEILMSNRGTTEHGVIRSDYPGGWPGDGVNAFTGEGLTGEQKQAREFVRTLLNWRKQSRAIHRGELTHYAPEDGVYVYFRHTDEEAVMVLLNNAGTPRRVSMERFSRMLAGYTHGRDLLGGERLNLAEAVTVAAKSGLVLELGH